jgi:hypothetical protein
LPLTSGVVGITSRGTGRNWPRRRDRAEGRRTSADPETVFCDFLQEYSEWGGAKLAFVARHPRRSIAATTAIVRLQRYTAILSPGPQGDAIRAGLLPRSSFLRTWAPVVAVLPLPDCPDSFGLGRPNQTLRRKVRSAQRLGIRCAIITDPGEKQSLLAATAAAERIHPIKRYRNADPDNSELLGYPFWLAAYSADGRPLLLAVTPFDGEWAMLRYFRSIGSGDEQSDARYFALDALARHLIGSGVRFLFDKESITTLPAGLRHYQRMVGFKICRVRLGQQETPSQQQIPAPRASEATVHPAFAEDSTPASGQAQAGSVG